MELLFDNLRNVFLKGKHGKVKEISMPDKRFLINLALIPVLSFIIVRSAFASSLEVVSIALLTVLLSRSRANIYALPFILAGVFSTIGTSHDYPGNLGAISVCALALLLPFTRKLPLNLKALIAGALSTSVKVGYYLWSGTLFLYGGGKIALDLLVLFGAIFVFYVFFEVLEKGINIERSPIEPVVAIASVILISMGGIWSAPVATMSILNITAFLITLIIGYGLGPGMGGIAGIASGFIVMLIADGTPALAGILGCCGVTGGFLFGRRRLLAGTCFAGMALVFGMVKGFPDLYISIYEPLAASAIFVLLPQKLMDKLSAAFSILRRDDEYYEQKAGRNAKEQIKQYSDLFTKLSLNSSAVRGYDPSRDIVTQQFKGMAKALDRISKEISADYRPISGRRPRFSIKTATASYAKEGRISGDSCLCSKISEGEYLLALSDGMGQGVRASEESTFTVNTLYNLVKAGFEVELALRMVNSILLQKSNDEILSTLDMGFINLYTGRARLFKIGAAVGFVKRGEGVKAVKMSALPLGIIEKVPVESISMQLRKGDMLIIVSDGVAEAEKCGRGAEWVQDAIGEIKSKDPQTMADLIINNAVQKYGLREKDDMTVIVACVV